MAITDVGADFTKTVFHLHAVDQRGAVVSVALASDTAGSIPEKGASILMQ